MCVLDCDNRTPLAGFDGSTQRTEGNGYLPVTMTDSISGETFLTDFDDVDLMSGNLLSQILSLGKFLRSGWAFHLGNKGEDCYGTTPRGAHRVNIQLGVDDLLRINHELRTGHAVKMLPSQPAAVNAVKRSATDATASFLHGTFFHRSSEKIFRTRALGATKGYTQIRLPVHHCGTCAQAKARKLGLSQQRDLCIRVHDPIFDDINELDSDDSEGSHDDLGYIAAVAGRQLGEQNVPRFDIDKLRPFQITVADNKDCPCAVRGGAVTTLIFIDHKTRTKHKIDLRTKANNGIAFGRIVARKGIHKTALCMQNIHRWLWINEACQVDSQQTRH